MKSLPFLLGALISVSSALFSLTPVFAHDLWIEKRDGEYVLLSGHRDSSHGGPLSIEYPAGIIQYVKCFDEGKMEVPADVSTDYPVTIKTSGSVIFVLTSSGYWTKTPYGTKNLPKNEAASPVRSWLSYESVKLIISWNERFTEPLTQELEIVPLGDPLILESGDKLRLAVTFEGRPAPHVPVTYDGSIRGETGTDGRINIRLRHGGLQIVQTSLTLPGDSAQADEVVHTANLNFKTGEVQ